MTTTITPEQWMGLDDSHISPLNHQHGLVESAKAAFLKMQSAAYGDGIDLQVVSSFRSFDRQLTIWQSKWLGQKAILDIHSQPIDINSLDELQKIHSIMTWSALPGASRHHWGTDLDVYDKQSVEKSGSKLNLVSEEYQSGGPCFELNQWLEKYASQYGFFRPYQDYHGGVAPEAWHLSFQPIADDIIAQMDVSQLATKLSNTEIGGKNAILNNIESLFKRYTLNGQHL